jgi:hypothetical protein
MVRQCSPIFHITAVASFLFWVVASGSGQHHFSQIFVGTDRQLAVPDWTDSGFLSSGLGVVVAGTCFASGKST